MAPDRDAPAPQRLRDQFSRLMGLTAAQMSRLVNDALAEVGARKYHFAVLAALDEFGPASQAELADRTGIHRSDLVATVNELAADGHAERAPDAGDRRRNTVTMTAAGADRFAELAAILQRCNETMLAPFDQTEREQFTGLLRRLHDHVANRPAR